MKKAISLSILVFLLLSCSSQKKYTNTFSEGFLQNKTIIFTLNQPNSIEIEMSGFTGGQTPSRPNPEICFKKSIEKLAEETNLNLQYRDTFEKTNDSEIHIEANLSRILWNFTFNSATMKAQMNYTIPSYNSSYESSGLFKNTMGGYGEDILYKAMKNANYLFLKELDKNNEFK